MSWDQSLRLNLWTAVAGDDGDVYRWAFIRITDDYILLNTETTGLPDENGLRDIVTLGITMVKD